MNAKNSVAQFYEHFKNSILGVIDTHDHAIIPVPGRLGDRLHDFGQAIAHPPPPGRVLRPAYPASIGEIAQVGLDNVQRGLEHLGPEIHERLIQARNRVKILAGGIVTSNDNGSLDVGNRTDVKVINKNNMSAVMDLLTEPALIEPGVINTKINGMHVAIEVPPEVVEKARRALAKKYNKKKQHEEVTSWSDDSLKLDFSDEEGCYNNEHSTFTDEISWITDESEYDDEDTEVSTVGTSHKKDSRSDEKEKCYSDSDYDEHCECPECSDSKCDCSMCCDDESIESDEEYDDEEDCDESTAESESLVEDVESLCGDSFTESASFISDVSDDEEDDETSSASSMHSGGHGRRVKIDLNRDQNSLNLAEVLKRSQRIVSKVSSDQATSSRRQHRDKR